MSVEILNRYTGAVLYKSDLSDVREAVIKAVEEDAILSGAILSGANLSDANLRGAILSGANLSGANLSDASLRGASLRGANLSDASLRGASLRGANLSDANLRGANLRDACLSDAYLRGANLRDAYLRGANLSDAILRGANLSGANLSDDTVLPTGETFGFYKSTILPSLLAAGGKSIEQVAEAWTCHEWANCPMHAAFDFNGTFSADAPPIVHLLRPRIEQFVQLFDAGLLPCPVELPAVDAAKGGAA